jgi:hypothetical protein
MEITLPRALFLVLFFGGSSAACGTSAVEQATPTSASNGGEAPVTARGSAGGAPASTSDSLSVLNDDRPRGELPRERIEAGIASARPALGACIERARERGGESEGRVVVTFVIEPDGRVGAAAYLVSTLADDRLAECILGVFRGLSFDRPSGGIVMVSHPFEFHVTRPALSRRS